MKEKQKYTPKYWIFHSKENDDIFIKTGAKSFIECKLRAEVLYPKEFQEYSEGLSIYAINLFEVKYTNAAD